MPSNLEPQFEGILDCDAKAAVQEWSPSGALEPQFEGILVCDAKAAVEEWSPSRKSRFAIMKCAWEWNPTFRVKQFNFCFLFCVAKAGRQVSFNCRAARR